MVCLLVAMASFILPLPLVFSTDVYIEVLDSTRVHPETYEWARKMAVDALEYDEVCTGQEIGDVVS